MMFPWFAFVQQASRRLLTPLVKGARVSPDVAITDELTRKNRQRGADGFTLRAHARRTVRLVTTNGVLVCAFPAGRSESMQ